MVKHSGQLDRVFNALANPTRRQILELLQGKERGVTDLASPFEMSLAAVSKHLKVLEQAGLVHRTRDGRVHRMRVDPGPLAEARDWVGAYVQFWEHKLDALDRFLQTEPTSPAAQPAASPTPHQED